MDVCSRIQTPLIWVPPSLLCCKHRLWPLLSCLPALAHTRGNAEALGPPFCPSSGFPLFPPWLLRCRRSLSASVPFFAVSPGCWLPLFAWAQTLVLFSAVREHARYNASALGRDSFLSVITDSCFSGFRSCAVSGRPGEERRQGSENNQARQGISRLGGKARLYILRIRGR